MHCPKCGQQQISDETRFCSRCGFLLTGVAEVVANNGIIPRTIQGTSPSASSPKRRGIKMGLFIFLLSFLIVPIIAILTIAVNAREPFVVAIAAILLTMGGLLRMAYALMFESSEPGGLTLEQKLVAATPLKGRSTVPMALPPSQVIPVDAYVSPTAGQWRDTNDLQPHPGSVTDSTTKLLTKEQDQ